MAERISSYPNDEEARGHSGAGPGPVSGVSFPTTHVISRLAILSSDLDVRRTAMSHFFGRYKDAIYSYFRSLRFGFDRHEAEDLLQRISVKLADEGKLLKTYDPYRASLRRYLRGVLYKEAASYLKEKMRNGQFVPIHEVGSDIMDSNIEEPGVPMDNLWSRVLLARAIKQVRRMQRERPRRISRPSGLHLFILMEGRGMKSTDLAKKYEKYHVTPDAIRARKNLAEWRLREILGASYGKEQL